MRYAVGTALMLLSVVATSAPCHADEDETGLVTDIDGDGAIVKPSDYITMIGRIEWTKLGPNGIRIKGKVDTGALTSSIDARNIEVYENGDEEWVRFEFKTNAGEAVLMERPVIRYVNISSSTGQEEGRPVVELPVCIAGVYQHAPVSLANREGLNYRFLVGRDALQRGKFVVNVAQAFSSSPDCSRPIQEAAGEEE